MMGNDLDALGGTIVALAVLVFGLVLLVAVGTLAAIVWYMFSLVIAYIRYRMYLAEAGATFDDVASRLGVDYPVDELMKATWGAGIELPDEGFENPVDWMVGTPVGIEREDA
jgi:hypothetical protein